MAARIARVLAVLLVASALGCSRRASQSPVYTQAPKAPQATALPSPLPPTPTRSGAPMALTVESAGSLRPTGRAEMPFPSQPRWAPDGSEISIRGEGVIQMYSGDLRQMTANIELGGYTLLDHAPGPSWMAVTADQASIEIRDIKTGELARTLQPGGLTYTAAFSPDGRNLAVGLSDIWVVEVYDLETEAPPLVFSGFTTAAPVYAIAYCADGKALLWMARATVQRMALETGEFGMELWHEDPVQSVATAPGSDLVATAAAGTVNVEFLPMINLWTLSSGTPLGVLLPGEAVPAALAFTPDGSLLAAGSGSAIQLYDTARQTLLAQYDSGGGAVTGLAVSPDGYRLVSTTADGSITLWQVIQ